MDDAYDLVVIGAGPAGQVAAELAAILVEQLDETEAGGTA